MMIANNNFWVDILTLTKPRITMMTALVAFGGLLQAGGVLDPVKCFFALLGISALVSGSSAFNMYMERDLDRLMMRTRDRPLPAGRIGASWGLSIGIGCSLSAGALLYLYTNPLTLALGFFALIIYVFMYTPLKRVSWLALMVGSVAGAMPVAIGYTSSAGVMDLKAFSLFAWAFLWQIPHFLAISIFLESEYAAAGFPVLSSVTGMRSAKRVLLVSSWLLAFSTIGLYLSGVIDGYHLLANLALGAVFLYICHRGASSDDSEAWARKVFRSSLVYQAILFFGLIINAVLGY